MNPLAVLQQIPPEVRRWMLIVYTLVAATFAVLQLVGVDWDFDTINLVMMLVGGYLGLQSAANVPSRNGVDPDG